jgi:cellobiose-specific phosphotransferase system component IIC
MERLNDLSMGRKLALGAAVLLLIDTFFAWQKVEVGVPGIATVSAKANAWHGFWGVLLGLLTIALIAWLAARALGVALPDAVPDGLTTLALGVLILAFALIKNLADDYSAWASYVGIVLAALVALGAWQVFQESGEELPRTAAKPTT